MVEHGLWEAIKTLGNWIMVPVSALLSYILYKTKKKEQELQDIKGNINKLEVSHEISVIEVREMKSDIKDIKHSIERISDKLWQAKER